MKVVVLGAGRMGRRHIQAATEAGLDVVAVADASDEALATAERERRLSRESLFRDPRAAIAHARPDVAIVATTSPAHAELTCLAAESGTKFILCEKPMATSLRECDRMLDACRRSGARLAVNHQMRFMEYYTEPKRLLESPELGGLTSIVVAAGNMGLAMNGTHYFELLRFMTGETADTVSAWLAAEKIPNPRGAQFSDRGGTIVATTRSRKRLVIECGVDQGHGVKTIFSARLGQIVVDELAGLVYVTAREAEHRELPTTRYGMPSVNTIRTLPPPDMVVLSRRVLEALVSGRDVPGGEEGRATVAAAVAAHVSDEGGHAPVAVDERLPVERSFPWA